MRQEPTENMTAKELFEHGDRWTDERARQALPILIRLAKAARRITYGELNQEIASVFGVKPRTKPRYGGVLGKVGNVLRKLGKEWGVDIPPINVLVVNANDGVPGPGFDPFLERYVATHMQERLTKNNEAAMLERATEAVFDYPGWDDVARYFGLNIDNEILEYHPISLAKPSPVQGGESRNHRMLKEYVAVHPELFRDYGTFPAGEVEYLLLSGDQVDVLFRTEYLTLAVEVKTAEAGPGELTRGIFQCVKYRAVLRAMHAVASELVAVKAVLVTPKAVTGEHKAAACRLDVRLKTVRMPR